MTPVSIAGVALACARGDTLRQAIAEVYAGQTTHGTRRIPTIDGERAIPYFAMESSDEAPIETLVVRVARAALADAGIDDRAKFSTLIVGSSSLHIAEAERRGGSNVDGDINEIARRTKTNLGIAGPDYTINTACTSSAHALLLAHTLLTAGTCDVALVLGVEIANLTTAAGFQAMQLLGTASRPFDAQRDGLVLGEAVAALVLAREPVAGTPQLLGGANGIDTASPAGADPSGAAMVAVMRRALARAGVTAQQIELIKAQAAGSRMNDATEAGAIAQLFKNAPTVTSLKGSIGHVLGASGGAELALLIGCWRAGFTPGTAGFAEPDPALPLQPLRERLAHVPRRALLNFVGFGGGQASLVVGAAP